MESIFKKYEKEISLPLIQLRLAISLKEPIRDRKPKEKGLEENMEQIKNKLEQVDILATKIIEEAAKEATPSPIYKRTKKISSKTKTALEKIRNCHALLEKKPRLRSTKSIEKHNKQIMEEFQNLYDTIRKITRIIK